MKIIKCSPVVEDERGSIMDIVQTCPVEHATIITSKAGAERGNHFHKQSTQYVFLLSGRLQAYARKENGPVESVTVDAGALIINEPREQHALVALEESAFLVLTHGPRGGDAYESDTFRLTERLCEVKQ